MSKAACRKGLVKKDRGVAVAVSQYTVTPVPGISVFSNRRLDSGLIYALISSLFCYDPALRPPSDAPGERPDPASLSTTRTPVRPVVSTLLMFSPWRYGEGHSTGLEFPQPPARTSDKSLTCRGIDEAPLLCSVSGTRKLPARGKRPGPLSGHEVPKKLDLRPTERALCRIKNHSVFSYSIEYKTRRWPPQLYRRYPRFDRLCPPFASLNAAECTRAAETTIPVRNTLSPTTLPARLRRCRKN